MRVHRGAQGSWELESLKGGPVGDRADGSICRAGGSGAGAGCGVGVGTKALGARTLVDGGLGGKGARRPSPRLPG